MKKQFFKRKIALLLTLVMAVSAVLTGCGSLAGASGYFVKNFRGTRAVTISSQKLDMYVNTTISCTFNNYFNDKFDFTKENNILRHFCFVSLMDAHDIGVASFNDKPNTDETNNVAFLEEMGFVNVEQYVVGADAATDKDDTVAMVISHKYVGKASDGTALFFLNVSLCGTQGSNEWKSNFDFGSDTSDYTGDHPDWTNKDNHKGFDVAANRVIDCINTYIINHPTISIGKVVLAISGYSHGAAVANLVGSKIADNSKDIILKNYKSVTYTFATPRTTLSSNNTNAKYNTIHNYINEDDAVPNLPTESMGYRRYGQDHTFSIQNNEERKSVFNNRVDAIIAADKANGIASIVTHYDASCAGTVKTVLNNLLSDRNDVYTIIEDEAHKSYSLGINEEYATPEAAQQAGNAFLADLGNKGYGQYFKDAGVTTQTHLVTVDYDDEGNPIDAEIPHYVWSCYVGDGVLIEVFNTVISCALQGDKENIFNNRFLITYSRHNADFGTLTQAMIWNTTYFSNAHNPLAYFTGCVG